MASVVMRFPEGKTKAVTLSYDDGVQQDARLLEIMKANGLKGTFNLNTGLYAEEGMVYPQDQIVSRVMTKAQTTALFSDSGMEVAVHGLHHPFLEQLAPEICTYEVLQDRINLENQFETVVRGLAYPFGTYDDQVVTCLKSCGIAYARTVRSSGTFEIPSDWLRLEPTCHHDDPRLMELARTFVDKIIIHKSWLFYLWGHSYEFDKNNNWHVIEEFAQYMGNRDDIWYATNLEIFDYVEAYRSLRFSADGRRVVNPTAYKLWVEVDHKSYCLAPGKEMVFA